MTDSKYYTPSIEEFHVGFEYEVQQLDEHGYYTNEYAIFELERDDLFPEDLTHYRVKYLDKEDIESLGFVCTGEAGNGIEKEFQLYASEKYTFVLSVSFDNWMEIEVIKTYPDNEITITLFNGKIKNKSELKTLLKQLGICNQQEIENEF